MFLRIELLHAAFSLASAFLHFKIEIIILSTDPFALPSYLEQF